MYPYSLDRPPIFNNSNIKKYAIIIPKSLISTRSVDNKILYTTLIFSTLFPSCLFKYSLWSQLLQLFIIFLLKKNLEKKFCNMGICGKHATLLFTHAKSRCEFENYTPINKYIIISFIFIFIFVSD